MGMIELWEKEREIIEWSREYVRKGDSLFYDCADRFQSKAAFQEIVILSRFVGSKGLLFLPNNQNSKFLNKVINLYKITNLRRVNRVPGEYQKYSTVITTDERFLS